MKSTRTAAKVSTSLDQRLDMYGLAAITAGVGVLALAQPAEAKIVYTPSNVNIHGTYNLDLNHDGITDYVLSNSHVSGLECGSHPHVKDVLIAHGDSANHNSDAIVGRPSTSQTFAFELTKGTRIGSSKVFGAGYAEMAQWTYGNFRTRFERCKSTNYDKGYWVNVEQRYLGFKFKIKEKIHYGWARLNVQLVSGKGIVAKLTGYAYETIAGKAIKAGQIKEAPDDWSEDDFGPDGSVKNRLPDGAPPAMLGMLALGARSVTMWRRKEEAVVAE